MQVLPGEVERVEWKQASRGPLSAVHDSREMIESKIGVIHVIKDESQIIPYCILHLTRDQMDSGAVSPSMAM